MAMDKDLNPMTTSADTRGLGMKGILGARLRKTALLAIGLVASLTVSAAETFEYIHTDALGSPVAVTDANGVVIERTVYEPYGAVVGGAVKDGPGYTGHVSDSATGLSYMQQRYMDPETGAFLSVDPVTAHQQPVVQFSRYRYANSNPYKFTDPDGRLGWLAPIIFGLGAYFTSGPANAPAPGEAIESMPAGDQIAAALPPGKIAGVVKFAIKSEKGLRRPYIRKDVRAEVEKRAPRTEDGRAIDPNTQRPIDGKPDLGHKTGNEHRSEKAKAESQGLTQKQFNDRMNNPDKYQLEDPSSNRSHRFEDKKR